MNKEDELNTISSSYDNKNNVKKELTEEETQEKIKKSKTLRSSNKPKTRKGNRRSKNEISENTRKVKFNNNIIFIDVECWKKYNYEQTADENFDAIFNSFDKEEKDNVNNNKNNKNSNKKQKDKRDNVSCTCNII